jgi:hypothetical protein
MNQIYLDTARLLTQVAPIVFQDGVFALKGGTAINSDRCDHELEGPAKTRVNRVQRGPTPSTPSVLVSMEMQV